MPNELLSIYEAAHASTMSTSLLDDLIEVLMLPLLFATSSANRVLQITELLELILLSLPVHDLLLSQSNSRAFRETIQGSISIKQKLFLAPATKLHKTLQLNPLLISMNEVGGPVSRISKHVQPDDIQRVQVGRAKYLAFPHRGKYYTAYVGPCRQATPMPSPTTDTDVEYVSWDIRELCTGYDPDADSAQHRFQPWQIERLHYHSSAWDMRLYHGENEVRVSVWQCDHGGPESPCVRYRRGQHILKNGTVRELFEGIDQCVQREVQQRASEEEAKRQERAQAAEGRCWATLFSTLHSTDWTTY